MECNNRSVTIRRVARQLRQDQSRHVGCPAARVNDLQRVRAGFDAEFLCLALERDLGLGR